MPKFALWGCNITGALDIETRDQLIKTPRFISAVADCSGIIWAGWAGVVYRTNDGIRICGAPSAGLSPPFSVKRVLGFDSIAAYLDSEGFVRDLGTRKSSLRWDDVTISGTGVVYAFKRRFGLLYSASLDDFFADISVRLSHPAFNPDHPASVHSMESRAFIHSAGPMHQLFEIEKELNPIGDLEGHELKIVTGSSNRLGIVTDAGSAYVLEKRSREVEMIDAGGDVRLLGLGSDFDVVVVEDKLLVKGNNEFGQLGRADTDEFAEVHLEGRILDVVCSRWATGVTMHAAE